MYYYWKTNDYQNIDQPYVMSVLTQNCKVFSQAGIASYTVTKEKNFRFKPTCQKGHILCHETRYIRYLFITHIK